MRPCGRPMRAGMRMVSGTRWHPMGVDRFSGAPWHLSKIKFLYASCGHAYAIPRPVLTDSWRQISPLLRKFNAINSDPWTAKGLGQSDE